MHTKPSTLCNIMHTHWSDLELFLLSMQLCGGGDLQIFSGCSCSSTFALHSFTGGILDIFFSPERMACSLCTTPTNPHHTQFSPLSLSPPSPWPVPLQALPSPPLPFPDLSLTHISIGLLMNIETVSVNSNPHSIPTLRWPFLIHTTSQQCVGSSEVSSGKRTLQHIKKKLNPNTMQKGEIEPLEPP